MGRISPERLAKAQEQLKIISKEYKHLTDAGYNVLTYDIRNHGDSRAANNGISGIGRWEWRDCVGVTKYVDNHPTLSKMTVGLYGQCMGGNSQ
jgi:alpha/beta superfamily hydrolase